MKIEGSTTLRVPTDVVWSVLTNPATLMALLPASQILSQNDKTWRAQVNVATGLGVSPFTFLLELLDERPPEYLKMTGRGYGESNSVDVIGTLDLTGDDTVVTVRWQADVVVGGVLASVGQRSIPYVVGQHIEDLLERIERQYAVAAG
jgi:carbon monoxide dehydrogenase subunit G